MTHTSSIINIAREKPFHSRTAGLDFCYVSSLSWYVLNLLGLRGVTALFLERGDSNAAALPGASDAAMMQMQMTAQPGAAPPDIVKLYRSELENLDLVAHSYDLENVEERLLARSSSSHA